MKKKRMQEAAAALAAVAPLRRSVSAGDIVKRRPVTFADPVHKDAKPIEGVVIYVHPKGRFHVVEFAGRLGTIREAFPGV